MPIEELRVAHQDTLLGNVWHLGNPLLSIAVYYLVFGVVLGVDRGVDNFILWLTVGVFTFGLTSRTVLGGAESISTNQGLMRSIRFPRALLPVSVVISRLLTRSGSSSAVLVVVALLTGEGDLAAVGGAAVRPRGPHGVQPRRGVHRRPAQRLVPRRPADHPVPLPPADVRVGRDVPDRTRSSASPTGPCRCCSCVDQLNPMRRILDMYRWVFLGDPMAFDDVVHAIASCRS